MTGGGSSANRMAPALSKEEGAPPASVFDELSPFEASFVKRMRIIDILGSA